MGTLFFVTGLADEQLDRLNDAGVRCTKQALAVPSGRFRLAKLIGLDTPSAKVVPGYLFQAEEFNSVLEYLGAVEKKRIPLDEPNTVFVKLKFSKQPKPVVSVYSWHDGKGPDETPYIDIVRETLLPRVKTDIVLHVSGKPEFRKPENDGLLHIHVWATPYSNTPRDPRMLFGVPLRDSMFEPTGQNTPILDEDMLAAGELVGNGDAYCFFNAIATGAETELMLFRRFCEELDAVRHLDAAGREKHLAALKAREEPARRAAYLKVCSARIERERGEVDAEVKKAEARVKKTQSEYEAALNALDRANERAESFRVGNGTMTAKLEAEFARFHSDPKFVRVVPSESEVNIDTRTLYYLNGTKVLRIGEMRIQILLHPGHEHNPVRFFNLTLLKEGKKMETQHPLVNRDGSCCLGNARERVEVLIKEREIYAVAELLVQFLESAGGSGHFSGWPIVSGRELERLREQGLLPVGA